MTTTASSIEPLENRIAPAVFFVSSNSLDIFKSASAGGGSAEDTPDETDARTAAGVARAIFMNTGDSLVFDDNNDGVKDPQERVLIAVTGGKAMVFFRDAAGPTVGAFDPNEISGLAVGDGFKAKINSDVNGSIATTLDATGKFTGTTLQFSSIAGLAIAGAVSGDIVAGKNIGNVSIGSGLFTASAMRSVSNIETGSTGANESVGYGATSFVLTFAQPAGANGGSIKNVRLENGALKIATGAGGHVTSGIANGGAGGSIVGLTIIDSPVITNLFTGGGGDSVSGKGGKSGGIANTKVALHSNTNVAEFTVMVRNGGASASGVGGASGSIIGSRFEILDDIQALFVSSGIGGTGGAGGGAGGSLIGTTISVTGSVGRVEGGAVVGGSFLVFAGLGGSTAAVQGSMIGCTIQALGVGEAIGNLSVFAGQNITGTPGAVGSAGGSMTSTAIRILSAIGFDPGSGPTGSITIGAGAGGDGSVKGGAGGMLLNDTFQFLGPIDFGAGGLEFFGGSGGGLVAGSHGVTSGAGGAIVNLDLTFGDMVKSFIVVDAGDGGFIDANTGKAGSGGAVKAATIMAAKEIRGFSLLGGEGGGSNALSSATGSGVGGAISGINATFHEVTNIVTFAGGKGGSAGHGNGGRGGALSSVNLSTGIVGGDLTVRGGDGRDGATTSGSGGSGGALGKVHVSGSAASTVSIRGGDGGAGHDAPGGKSGAASGITLDLLGPAGIVNIRQGDGGDVASGTGVGGAGASLANVIINAFAHAFSVNVGISVAGQGGGVAGGGAGGNASNIVANLFAGVDSLTIRSQQGGEAGSSGSGGKAGLVSKVQVNDFSGGDAAIRIDGGAGGEAHGATGKGGASGSLSAIAVNSPTALVLLETFNGGNSEFVGGAAGSINGATVVAGELIVSAGDGGAGITPQGMGGAGGSVSGLLVNGLRTIAQRIAAGDGGSGNLGGGNGGSIRNVFVAGDIGDFGSSFGFMGMGGLSAGRAGIGGTSAIAGSISNVTATRIAAIIAGGPPNGALTAANAVFSLQKINALVIGADLNRDENLAFTNNNGSPGYQLGSGDIALDGLVILRQPGDLDALPVKPHFAVVV